MTPGIVAAEAAQLECPLLLLFGDVDTSPDPHAEVELLPRLPRYHAGVAARLGSYAQLRIDAARWLAAASAEWLELARLALRHRSLGERRLHAESAP